MRDWKPTPSRPHGMPVQHDDEDLSTDALPTIVRPPTDDEELVGQLPTRPRQAPMRSDVVGVPIAAATPAPLPMAPRPVRTSEPSPAPAHGHAPHPSAQPPHIPPGDGRPSFVGPPSEPVPLEPLSQNGLFVTSFHFRRSRTYAFVVDGAGRPVEIGSGRYARVFLGHERWLESLTDVERPVVIKMLHKNIAPADAQRFRMEKEILERVQGHPAIVELLGTGTCTDPRVPPAIQTLCEGEFVILEKLDMTLEERLKGSRSAGAREDLLAFDMYDRLLRVLEYMIPIASAVEFAHLVRNVCHRDINPANILIKVPDPQLAGSKTEVRLGDFGVAKADDAHAPGVTSFINGVPGAMYFQSPEQESNVLELLVSVQQGSTEVDYFEDFYINVTRNDTFAIFNHREQYPILYTDRPRRKIVLAHAYRDPSESNIRAHVRKAVGRPADIYSLGALFYYLISGAAANPKTLMDTFQRFIEYDRADETNTIDAYLRHEYRIIDSLRSNKGDGPGDVPIADRFFGYTHFLDGNGELIHFAVMMIIARAMMRNKPDSYCQAHDLETRGISLFVRDLTSLYSLYGLGETVPPQLPIGGPAAMRGPRSGGGMIRQIYDDLLSAFGGPKKKKS